LSQRNAETLTAFAGADRVSDVATEALPSVATIDAVWGADKGPTARENVALLLLAGMVTEAGSVSAPELVESVSVVVELGSDLDTEIVHAVLA
jgi:hypothetical protein